MLKGAVSRETIAITALEYESLNGLGDGDKKKQL
jgi:hypothetical protein